MRQPDRRVTGLVGSSAVSRLTTGRLRRGDGLIVVE